MKKLFTLLLALIASISMHATEIIDGIKYKLNSTDMTAEVTDAITDSGDVVIPSSVTYQNNEYIVISIGDFAFYLCTGLTSVSIPYSVTSIGEFAFFECTGLTSVSIPYSVTSIGEFAFWKCESLTSVVIPNSVTSIGEQAFWKCESLTSITNYAIVPQAINSNVFDFVNKSTCTLYVPNTSIAAYQAADGWGDFTNILPLLYFTVNYLNKAGGVMESEQVLLSFPEAPEIGGFTFSYWKVVEGDIADGINIQAVYESNNPTSAPAVFTNPSNPAQKLIRNGNVYILTDDKIYTATGAEVK